MPIDIYENVLRFQIPIQHILRMDVLQAEQHLRKVEPCLLLRKPRLALKQIEQLATRAKVDHKVQVLLTLECVLQLDHEGVLQQSLHHLQFTEDLLVAALLFEDELFAHRFYGQKLPGIFLASEVHFFSKATLADHLDLLIVVDRNLGVLGLAL